MRLGAYIDVSLMPPRPERLSEIGEYLASLKFDAVFIEWGTLFPWEFDDRVRGEWCFSEDTVVGLHRELTRKKIEHIPVLSAANPASLRWDSLFPALASDGNDTDGCVRRLVLTMLGDMHALLPDVARVCLNALSGPQRGAALRARESRIIRALSRDLVPMRLTAVTVDSDEGEAWTSTEPHPSRPALALIDAPDDTAHSCAVSPEWRLATIADRIRAARPDAGFPEAARIEYERAVRAARAFETFEAAMSDAWAEYRTAAEMILLATANRERTRADAIDVSDGPRALTKAFETRLKRLDRAADALYEATRHGIDSAVFERRVRVLVEPLREAYESCRSRSRVLGFRFGTQPYGST